jgi:hypothetical protein
MFDTPLSGRTGIIKNSVKNRMPFFSVNGVTAPHLEQRIAPAVCSLPQVKNFVPIISIFHSVSRVKDLIKYNKTALVCK